ncbi:F-box-like domain protein [Ceratobasidium sp. AG-Ba]|nr:F-box-like domain protein [Ceratobasidium sp. AG-Ba]
MEILQTNCSKLESLYVKIVNEDPYDWEYGTLRIFRFSGIRRLALEVFEVAEFDEKCTEMFASLLRACPNLETLELGLSVDTIHHCWSFSKICAQIEDTTFDSLRSLRLYGALVSTLAGDQDGPIRSFFARHPHIQKLSLLTNQPNDLTHNLSDVSGAFKSLLYFEGPAFICKAIAQSQAATRLEYLRLTNVSDEDEEGYDGGDVAWSDFHLLQRLPALRRLVLEFAEDGLDDDNQILRSIFNEKSASLEDFEIKSGYTPVNSVRAIDISYRSTLTQNTPGRLNQRATIPTKSPSFGN